MKGRTSLVLLGLAIASVAFVVLWEKDQPGTTERLALAGKLLPNLDPEKVEKLTLKRRDGTVVATRQTGRWTLEQPLAEPADDLVLQGIVRDLGEAPVLGRFAPSEVTGGDSATGLGDDQCVATLVAAGREIVVRIGSRDIGAGRRYAQVGTAPELVLVDDTIARAIEKPLEKLRDHTLFQAASIDIHRFSVERAGEPTLTFERRGGEAWWITAPIEDAADNSSVGALISKLLSLRAESFLDSAPTTLPGSGAPWLGLKLFDSTGRLLGSLTVGEVAAGNELRFATTDRRSEPFHIRTSEIAVELKKPASAWRSMLAIDTSVWDLAELEIRRGDQRLLVRRAQSDDGKKNWVAGDPPDIAIDEGKIVELSSKLARVDCKRLADETTWSAAELDTPQATVTLRHEDRARFPDSELWIGKAAGSNEVFAGVPGRKTVLVVDAAIAAELDPVKLRR